MPEDYYIGYEIIGYQQIKIIGFDRTREKAIKRAKTLKCKAIKISSGNDVFQEEAVEWLIDLGYVGVELKEGLNSIIKGAKILFD